MGAPRKIRKKYTTPSHPWQAVRIAEERVLVTEYGLKNKKEIWKADSLLKNFTGQAKQLIPATNEQAEKEKKQLLNRLARMGLLKEQNLNAVLNLTLKDILDRRLQTVIYKKGMARTVHQARQFIVHEHIFVGDKKVSIPSYMVMGGEENTITFDQYSKIKEDTHPERAKPAKKTVRKKPARRKEYR